MSFNPNLSKQAQDLIFSRKVLHSALLFNNSKFPQIFPQKHQGICLDETLTFKNHIKKGNKGIGFSCKQHNFLPRSVGWTLYHVRCMCYFYKQFILYVDGCASLALLLKTLISTSFVLYFDDVNYHLVIFPLNSVILELM